MMKYFMVTLVLSAGWAACGGPEKQAAEAATESRTPFVSKNTDKLNRSFEKLLTAYYSLKDALVEYDTLKANAAANDIAASADSVALDEIKNDSLGAVVETAKSYILSISGSAKALPGKKELYDKKKEFQQISDAMYDLVRTVRYDQAVIYHQHCPMAFNDEEEAFWLSNSNTVVNPYLGKKHPKYKDGMLECGDITDSLDFSAD